MLRAAGWGLRMAISRSARLPARDAVIHHDACDRDDAVISAEHSRTKPVEPIGHRTHVWLDRMRDGVTAHGHRKIVGFGPLVRARVTR